MEGGEAAQREGEGVRRGGEEGGGREDLGLTSAGGGFGLGEGAAAGAVGLAEPQIAAVASAGWSRLGDFELL